MSADMGCDRSTILLLLKKAGSKTDIVYLKRLVENYVYTNETLKIAKKEKSGWV
ncbi:MAG: hypothetical protein ACXVIS_09860 [Halobacteriota archaeon]